jgi:hypothetical protein
MSESASILACIIHKNKKNGNYEKRKIHEKVIIVRSAELMNTITHVLQSFCLFLLRHSVKLLLRFLERPVKFMTGIVIILFEYFVCFVVNRPAFRSL